MLLGDGGLSSPSSVKFSTPDAELVDAVRTLLPEGAEFVRLSTYDWRIRGAGARAGASFDDTAEDLADPARLRTLHEGGATASALARRLGVTPQIVRRRIRSAGGEPRPRDRNPVLNALRGLGLAGSRSSTKFVPSAYKNAPVAVRHALLQGLLDTDGTVGAARATGGSSVSFVSASPRLASDLAWLVRSLGGRAVLKDIQKSYRRPDGTLFTGDYVQVSVTLPNDRAPFRLDRKAERVPFRTRYRQHRLGIRSIEYHSTEATQCIRVDHPTHMYVTDNFTPTHNTAEMAIGAMELKRMGMITKPAVVIPNHMLEQFTREWLQIYPAARILAANTDTLAGDKRRVFVARAAANDWDAVILTREAFRRLPVEPETATVFMNHELDLMRTTLEHAADLEPTTVKRIEKRIARLEEKQKALLDVDRDPGITFEATGFDYLIVDELHDYKNLATVSRIPDANIDGAARATDLAVKIEYLRRTHGNRVVTGATATPIANSITEFHVMQRYLRPDLLRAAGVEAFDAWAATFGRTVDEIEMAPQGGGSFRMKTRFAKFQNVPELLRMFHVFADVKTAEDLNLPTPPLIERPDGQRLPQTIAIDAPPEVLDYVRQLGKRADDVASKAVTPDVDNMLKISTDGRKAALDIRIVDPTATPGRVPLDTIADKIARIHHEHADDRFIDVRTGEPSPTPGALQIVFCDLGTPNPTRWNAYDELRRKLTDRGVPDGGIRYIHEAKNDVEKARLFAAARDGRIAVLIGSTGKMGVGTNVQARARALHDVDAPWKPAELHQRHGRVERQGNQNTEIEIYQYVVTGTFSAYMWQALERKSRFINQIMRGRLDVRELDDLGADTLTAAEAKALASGNPLLLERSVALNEMTRLERLERAYHRNQRTLHATLRGLDDRDQTLTRDLVQLDAAKTRAQDLTGDRFRIDGRQHTSRTDAADALTRWADRAGIRWARPVTDDRPRGIVGEISGFPITARTRTDLGNVQLQLDIEGIPGARVRVPTERLQVAGDVGIIRMLENRVSDIPRLIDTAHQQQREVAASRADAETALARPFAHSDALTHARTELDRIDAQLAALADDDQVQKHEPAEASLAPIQERLTQLRDTVTHTATAVQQLERIHAITNQTEQPHAEAIDDFPVSIGQQFRGPRL